MKIQILSCGSTDFFFFLFHSHQKPKSWHFFSHQVNVERKQFFFFLPINIHYFNFLFIGNVIFISSVQFSSVTQLCPTLCDPINCSTPGLPVHHQLLEITKTHVHRVSLYISSRWCHPAISSSVFTFPPALNPSQHQSLFQRVHSSHEVAKVLEFQL